MSNAVAAVAPSEPEWAAWAAIDWADQKNFWRLSVCLRLPPLFLGGAPPNRPCWSIKRASAIAWRRCYQRVSEGFGLFCLTRFGRVRRRKEGTCSCHPTPLPLRPVARL